MVSSPGSLALQREKREIFHSGEFCFLLHRGSSGPSASHPVPYAAETVVGIQVWHRGSGDESDSRWADCSNLMAPPSLLPPKPVVAIPFHSPRPTRHWTPR